MLTKNDLLQIRTVVREEVQGEITVALKPVKRKLNLLYKDFHSFVNHFDKRLSTVEADVKELQTN